MNEGERSAGEVLEGRYRLVERLGQGGFGDVWRADELLPDGKPLREVALKLLVRAVASDWAEEARIIASLRHPALVTVYAAGRVATSDGDVPFVAMELLRGENLASRGTRGRRVAWRRVLAWAREVASALDEIHRAGVVHLDLKPANLFLTDGGLKVLDFGIARQGRTREVVGISEGDALSTAAFLARETPPSVRGEPRALLTEYAVGTPGYMAPEVIEGGEATHAADAYALAACIVELTSGALPQDVGPRPSRDDVTATAAWLGAVQAATVHGRLRDLSGADMPPALVALVLRWLRLDPIVREVSLGGLRAALDAVWVRPFGAPKAPFRGLAPFGIDGEGVLPGREPESERLGRELADGPCLVLHGPRGAGLTSLALAGVVPGLARSFADGREDWRACHVRLGDEPTRALFDALDEWFEVHLPEFERRLDSTHEAWLPSLAERLRTAPLGLALVLDDGDDWMRAPASCPAVYAALRDATLELPGVRVLWLAHADGFADLVETELGRSLQPFARFLGPPSPTAADTLVRAPAEASGRRIEGVEAIVADVKAELSREGGHLAGVSLALERLWQGPLEVARWRELGGVVGALSAHAERVVGGLSGVALASAEWLLVRLVRADGRAVPRGLAELLEASLDPAATRAVARALIRDQVLVERDGKIALAHPALVSRWPRLHDRRLHDVDRLALLEEVRDAAMRWRQQGSSASGLFASDALGALERRFSSIEAELAADERAFVNACRAAHSRSRLQRAVVALGAFGLVLGLAGFERARSRHAEEQARELASARKTAAVERLVTASRRTADPYRRIALLGAALAEGSTDRLLALELVAATRRLPPATFLTLDPPSAPRFPWDGRYVLGAARAHVSLFDLLPDEGRDWGAVETRLAAHDEGIHDVEPLPYGRGFVSRGLDGTLKVWRVREDRSIGLAAVSPMRCERGLSRVLVADTAPILACGTADGIVRWDLRRSSEASTVPVAGRLLALSPDGRWIAAARQRRVSVWREGRAPAEVPLAQEEAVRVATFASRDDVLALVGPRKASLFDLTKDKPQMLLADAAREHGVGEPVRARFTETGVDLAVCDAQGDGRVVYLREGARAGEDGEPPSPLIACRLDQAGPATLRVPADYGALFEDPVALGPRKFEGGFALDDGRRLTRDLVTFEVAGQGLTEITQVSAPVVDAKGDSVVMVARVDEDVVWQHGRTIVAVGSGGELRFRREGNLLGGCPDGRVLTWRAEDAAWHVVDARKDRVVKRVRREPGFVLGADPSCRRLYVQHLDGRVASAPLDGSEQAVVEPQVVQPGGGGYAVDGYVYDVRPSPGGGEVEPGLWFAWSSGAMARADASGSLRSYGHAAPRATSMTDGPRAGELLFSDESGVVVRSIGAQDRRLVAALSDREWSDARVLPGGAVAALAWVGGLALVDLERAELLGWTELEGRGRLAPWDAEGSLLAYGHALVGPPTGDLIPLGPSLARAMAARASNLVGELDATGSPRVRLR